METFSLKGLVKVSLLASLFLPTILKAQENFAFSITPELTEKAVKEVGYFKVYNVKQKDVEYHPYIEGQVNTNEYNILLNKLEELKPQYDEYSEKLKQDSIIQVDLKTILQKIDLYLNSKEKADIKDKYLIQAQELSDKHNIQVTGENKSLFAQKLNDHGIIKNDTKTFRLYNGKKSSSKRDIEFYKSEIEKIKFDVPYKSPEVKKYLEIIDKIKTIQKTEIGKVLSSEVLKRQAFVIEQEINLNSLSGEFIEMSEKYMLAQKDIKNQIKANELTADNNFSGVYGMTQGYPLIKEKNSNNYYYLMSDRYLSYLLTNQRQEELIGIVNKLGYKEYKSNDRYDDNLYIKSKTSEIKLDTRTYIELKRNPNYISELDSDQAKISTLVKQTISHSKTLDKYLSQYRIQKNQIPTASINAWRTATENAQELMLQINKLSEKYDGNYSFSLLDKSNTLEIFSDNLLASKGVLGM